MVPIAEFSHLEATLLVHVFQIGMTRRIHRLSQRGPSLYPFYFRAAPVTIRAYERCGDNLSVLLSAEWRIKRNIRLFLLPYHIVNEWFSSITRSHIIVLIYLKLSRANTQETLHAERVDYFCCWACGCCFLVACGVTTAPIPLNLKEERRQRVN